MSRRPLIVESLNILKLRFFEMKLIVIRRNKLKFKMAKNKNNLKLN